MKFCFGQVKTEMPVGHLSQYIFMCQAHGMQGELHTCCCCSVTKSCLILWIPWAAACQASLFSTISQNLLKFVSVEWVILYNHLILCYPLLFCCQSFLASGFFSNESALRIRWLKCWSFSFSISSSDKHSGFISPKIDWFDLLAVLGPTLT